MVLPKGNGNSTLPHLHNATPNVNHSLVIQVTRKHPTTTHDNCFRKPHVLLKVLEKSSVIKLATHVQWARDVVDECERVHLQQSEVQVCKGRSK